MLLWSENKNINIPRIFGKKAGRRNLTLLIVITFSLNMFVSGCKPTVTGNLSDGSSVITGESSIIDSSDRSDTSSNTTDTSSEIIGASSDVNISSQSSTVSNGGTNTLLKTIVNYQPNSSGYTLVKGASDLIDLGSAASQTSHTVAVTAGVATKSISTENGTLKKSYKSLSFNKENARADFYMNFSTPKATSSSAPMMIEIMEVHDSNYVAFGYQVLVNDKEVYFRTYEEIASGTIHYFIPFSRDLATNPAKVKISIISKDDSRFNIGKIWGYNDFYALADQEGTLTKMGINLFCDQDISKANTFMKTFNGYTSFTAGSLYGYDYMNNTVDAGIASLSSLIAAASNTKSNAQLMLARYWSYTPYGPDGKGGIWSDLKYQQTLYNPGNGTYTSTTPNMWSNTCWESMTGKYITSAANSKIAAVIGPVADKLALLSAQGKSPNLLEIIMEWGTGYYHQSDFYGGDFSPEIVAAAKAEGITLDPSDGLSFEEKMFQYKIIAKMNQAMADTYRNAIGYNAVTVRNNSVKLPDYQVIDHIYSHGTQTSAQYISYDDRVDGWMSGIGDGYWPSSENMYWDTQRFYEYQMGYGRIACVNLEMAIHNGKKILQNYVKRCYMNGMEYVTLFNDQDSFNTDDNLREIDNLQSQKTLDPEHYERNIFSIDYMRDLKPDMITNKNTGVVSYDNCKVGTTGILFCADTKKAGTVTYLVENGGKAFTDGIKVTIEGMTDEGASIEFYGGTSLDNLQKVGTFEYGNRTNWFNAHSKYTADLTSSTKGVKKYYVQIRLSNIGASAANTSLRSVNVTLPWTETTGSKQSFTTTYKQARLQSLWIQQRTVTENLMGDYLDKSGQSDNAYVLAQKLYNFGRYQSAYKLLTGEISQLLPAKYAVQDSGKLGKYPVEITLESGNCAVVQLNKISIDEIRFSLFTDSYQNVTFKVSSLNNGDYYILDETAKNTFRIYRSSKGSQNAVAVKSNAVSFTVEASPYAAAKLAGTTLSGRAAVACDGDSIKLQVQDPKVSMYARFNTFYISNDCVFSRKKDGSTTTTKTFPKQNDMVTIELDSVGAVTKITSVYGEVTGTVKSFTPPAVTGNVTNGVIELNNGVKYEIEYDQSTTLFETSRLTGQARSFALTKIADSIKVGDTVTITYCPYTYSGSNRRIIKITG